MEPGSRQNPELCYDYDEGTVYLSTESDEAVLFHNASPEEFEQLKEIDEFIDECLQNVDRLLHILQRGLVIDSAVEEELQSLKHDVIRQFSEFERYKSLSEQSDFERVRRYAKVVYKVKRPLENVFECIGIVADLLVNYRHIARYRRKNHRREYVHHLFLNTCSVVEHTGIVAVNRLVSENGGLNPDQNQHNVQTVYEQVIQAGLHEVDDSDIVDLVGDADKSEVKRLKETRDRLAHKSPIVVDEEIPDGLQRNSYAYTETDLRELVVVSIKLNKMCSIVLTRFLFDHVRSAIEPYVAAIYQDRS